MNRVIHIFLLICFVYQGNAQTSEPIIQNQEMRYFFKNKSLFEQDPESLKFFRKAKTQNLLSHIFGGLSAVGLVGTAIGISKFENNGQSSDIAQAIVALGVITVSSVFGITGIITRNACKRNKRKAIIQLSNDPSLGLKDSYKINYEIHWVANTNGLGLALSF